MPIPPGPKFYAALAQRESGNDPKVLNAFGFMGPYQMGPPALQNAGNMDRSQRWTGKNGINSREDFLNSREVQDIAIPEYHVKLWSYIPKDARAAVGTIINNIKIKESGLLPEARLTKGQKVRSEQGG